MGGGRLFRVTCMHFAAVCCPCVGTFSLLFLDCIGFCIVWGLGDVAAPLHVPDSFAFSHRLSTLKIE